MLERSREHATARSEAIAQTATEKMQTLLRHEIERLRDLQRVNDHVREDEITVLETQAAELAARIEEAPLRLDSVRLIWRAE
jgi:ATP-dependent helicase HepA